MRALALLGVFVVAKVAILAGRPIQVSAWSPIAYFWQDVAVALAFLLLDTLIRRPFWGWTLYAMAITYAAISVPTARVLASPLTWPMIRAAGGPLSDSIKHHVTPVNLALAALVAATGVVLPRLLRPVRLRPRMAFVIAAVLFALPGPYARERVETIGLERNAVMALASTALPRLGRPGAAASTGEDWRTSPLAQPPVADDLSRWRGGAHGRNVVLILLESAGARYLGLYGADRDPMPNLTDLAANAMVFQDAYTVYPESIKSLFSVLCSRYPAMDTDADSYAGIATPSIASALKTEGYHTALFHSGRFMYLGMEAVIRSRGFDVLEDAGAIGGDHESSFGVDEPSTVRRALGWIDSIPRGEPFFLTYLPIAGHHPYETPEKGPFAGREESDRYLNALHYSDQALGMLLEGLRERGLDRETLFVIFGDHAEAFGQHEGNFGHSFFLYDENVRVPYLIAAPGLIAAPVRVERTISLIDTAPTILDLLGLAVADDYQGSSALDGQSRMALFYIDYSLSLVGLRDGPWKFIYELDTGRSKLFDISADPGESTDLSNSRQEQVTNYRNLLTRWGAAQKALILSQTR